jgi:hypothetical protein
VRSKLSKDMSKVADRPTSRGIRPSKLRNDLIVEQKKGVTSQPGDVSDASSESSDFFTRVYNVRYIVVSFTVSKCVHNIIHDFVRLSYHQPITWLVDPSAYPPLYLRTHMLVSTSTKTFFVSWKFYWALVSNFLVYLSECIVEVNTFDFNNPYLFWYWLQCSHPWRKLGSNMICKILYVTTRTTQ